MMVSSLKRALFAAVLVCVAVFLLFHVSARLTLQVTPFTVDNSLRGNEGFSSAPSTSSNAFADTLARTSLSKNDTRSSAPPDTLTGSSSPTNEASSNATLHAITGVRHGCDCNKTNYYPLSMAEFKSTFARHNNGRFTFSNTTYINDSYTIVIPCYKRDNAIVTLLNHFCKAPHIHKILFIWHNMERPVPAQFINRSCDVPYKFIHPKKNSLSNRFIPYDDIETEGIFTIDDDSYVQYPILNAGFEAFQAFPHLMVGFVSRTHSVVNGRYHYFRSEANLCYSTILTNSAFVHRRYLEIYSSPRLKLPREFVDQNMNGEDILMNGVVSDYLRHTEMDFIPACHSLLIGGDRVEIDIKGAGYAGIYHRPGHYEKRDKCMEMLAYFYGDLPLTCCHYMIKNPLA